MTTVAGRYNLVIEQGATFRVPITWYEDEEMTSPVNLTGFSATAQGRRRHESDAEVWELTDGDGITLGGAAVTFELLMDDTETDDLTGDGVYDLLLTSAGGEVTRLDLTLD
jgi:hypothetical protein